MHIDQKNLDALNAVLGVTLEVGDYREEVERVLKDYKKTAQLPGFRKGHVPMGLLRRQHGKSVTAETVEKRLRKALRDYIAEKGLALLGQPLPVPRSEVDWEQDTQHFAFEIGLAPSISMDLKAPNELIAYQIEADEKTIDEHVTRLREAHGTHTPLKAVCEGATLTGRFEEWDPEADRAVEGGLSREASFELSQLSASGAAALLGAELGEARFFDSKGFFRELMDWVSVLYIPGGEARTLDVRMRFTASNIESIEPAALDQALFDAVYGEGVIEGEAALLERVKADYERSFARRSEKQWFADARRFLIENTSFELPRDFLTRWIHFSQASITSQEQAESAYRDAEEALRWKLIEEQLARDYSIEVRPAEVKARALELARSEVWRYNVPDHSEEILESLADHLLKEPEQQERLSQQLFDEKLLKRLKEEMTYQTKSCSLEVFLQETAH